MNNLRRFAGKAGKFCLVFVLFCMIMPVSAMAAEKIDLTKPVSFTLFHRLDGVGEADVEYSIYRVGNVTADGKVSFTDPYKKLGLKLNTTNETILKSTAEALEAYVVRDDIAAMDTSKTDANGVVVFPTKGTMKPGVYLVLGKSYTTDDGRYCRLQPILVTLPIQENNNLLYDMKVESKYETGSTTKLAVRKEWVDKTTEYRPKEIEVQLINVSSGEIYKTVTLNEDNGWSASWSNLPTNTTWTVIEKSVPEYYEATYERSGYTIKITNTSDKEKPPVPDPEDPDPEPDPEPTSKKKTSSSSKLPQTGTYWWPVPILAAAGMIFMVLGLLRRKKDANT